MAVERGARHAGDAGDFFNRQTTFALQLRGPSQGRAGELGWPPPTEAGAQPGPGGSRPGPSDMGSVPRIGCGRREPGDAQAVVEDLLHEIVACLAGTAEVGQEKVTFQVGQVVQPGTQCGGDHPPTR